MNKTFDDLSKNLAGGISRRKAFLTFLAGAGALGFLGGGRAKAVSAAPAQCGRICLGVAMEVYEDCLGHKGGNPEVCFFELMKAYECCLSDCENQKTPKSCKA